MCVVGSLTAESWETDSCLTEYDPDSSVIICTCNMMHSELVSVKEDFTRKSTDKIQTRSVKILLKNSQNKINGSSYLLIALAGTIFLSNLIGSLAAWQQDNKDRILKLKNCVLSKQEENFVRAVSH